MQVRQGAEAAGLAHLLCPVIPALRFQRTAQHFHIFGNLTVGGF